MPRNAPCSSVSAGDLPLKAAAIVPDIILLSPCADELRRFAHAWRKGGGPSIRPLDLATALRPDQDIAVARSVLITLPTSLAPWREVIEAIAATARAKKIAFAVVTATAIGEAPHRFLTNLPDSTLRRLNKLYTQRSDNAARNVLTQFALAAGLTIPIEPNLSASEHSLQCERKPGRPQPCDLLEDAA